MAQNGREALLAAIASEPDASKLPVRVDRTTAAALLTRHFFPVSPRTLEAWDVPVRHVNGKALIDTADLFAAAQARLDAAPKIRGGKPPRRTRDERQPQHAA
jgi:hypothetical protein